MPLPDFQPGHVLEAKTGGYLVLSLTKEGVWYFVSGNDCSCKAGLEGFPRCVHRKQVAAFVAVINERLKRHTPPPNISAIVD